MVNPVEFSRAQPADPSETVQPEPILASQAVIVPAFKYTGVVLSPTVLLLAVAVPALR